MSVVTKIEVLINDEKCDLSMFISTGTIRRAMLNASTDDRAALYAGECDFAIVRQALHEMLDQFEQNCDINSDLYIEKHGKVKLI